MSGHYSIRFFFVARIKAIARYHVVIKRFPAPLQNASLGSRFRL